MKLYENVVIGNFLYGLGFAMASRDLLPASHTDLKEKPGQPNIFKNRLNQGDILSYVKIEPDGIDADDDWLVMGLKHHPSAAPLRLNGK